MNIQGKEKIIRRSCIFFVYTEHRITATNYDFDTKVLPAIVSKYIFNGKDINTMTFEA